MTPEMLGSIAKSRAALTEMLTRKAWEDDDFRRRFVADPKGMMAEFFGQPMPDTLRVTVHEESPGDLHFIVPVKPTPQAFEELSDADLEKIAGGVTPGAALLITTIASVVVAGGASVVLSAAGAGAVVVAGGVGAAMIGTFASGKW